MIRAGLRLRWLGYQRATSMARDMMAVVAMEASATSNTPVSTPSSIASRRKASVRRRTPISSRWWSEVSEVCSYWTIRARVWCSAWKETIASTTARTRSTGPRRSSQTRRTRSQFTSCPVRAISYSSASLEGKCMYRAAGLIPARNATCRVVVPWYPCSPKASSAAVSSFCAVGGRSAQASWTVSAAM